MAEEVKPQPIEGEEKRDIDKGHVQKEGGQKKDIAKVTARESAATTEQEKQKKNVFTELTQAMKEKRQLLLSKIDQIKGLREKLNNFNRSSVYALEKKKKKLEFKIATEAITLDKERELMKSIKGLDAEIKNAHKKEGERRALLSEIKVLNEEIEKLKNELDEMKLNLIKLRLERKKKRLEMHKRMEEREAKLRKPHLKEEELVVNLEDIAIIKREKGS